MRISWAALSRGVMMRDWLIFFVGGWLSYQISEAFMRDGFLSGLVHLFAAMFTIDVALPAALALWKWKDK